MLREQRRERNGELEKNVGEMFIKNKVLFNQKMPYQNSLQHPFSSIISKFKVEHFFIALSIFIYLSFQEEELTKRGSFL